MQINRQITSINRTVANRNGISYIVVHYVGATGGAEANCNYFANAYRGASAHYFVGHNGEIWQCVEDKDVAWHCGANSYKHPSCRNNNSIGVELCCRKDGNGNWYFEQATVNAAMELVKMLANKYGVPEGNILRHYDVTGKNCPAPYVSDGNAWAAFKAGCCGGSGGSSYVPAPSNPTTPSGGSYNGGSLVDYLKTVGLDSSMAARRGYAAQYGIPNYKGTAAQNTQLLNRMRQGQSKPPAPSGGGKGRYTGGSVVECCKHFGIAYDYPSRAGYAAQLGINGYSGSATQNVKLIELLNNKYAGGSGGTGGGPVIRGYNGGSLVDALKHAGMDSSMPARRALAAKYGISNYSGTATQNTWLLNILCGR